MYASNYAILRGVIQSIQIVDIQEKRRVCNIILTSNNKEYNIEYIHYGETLDISVHDIIEIEGCVGIAQRKQETDVMHCKVYTKTIRKINLGNNITEMQKKALDFNKVLFTGVVQGEATNFWTSNDNKTKGWGFKLIRSSKFPMKNTSMSDFTVVNISLFINAESNLPSYLLSGMPLQVVGTFSFIKNNDGHENIRITVSNGMLDFLPKVKNNNITNDTPPQVASAEEIPF